MLLLVAAAVPVQSASLLCRANWPGKQDSELLSVHPLPEDLEQKRGRGTISDPLFWVWGKRVAADWGLQPVPSTFLLCDSNACPQASIQR